MRIQVFAALAALVPAAVIAQGTPAAAHSGVPDSTLRPSAIDGEFASWLQARRAAGHGERPRLVQAGRFEALLLSPLAATTLAPDSVFGSMVGLCRAPLQLAAADSAELVSLDPWSAFDAAAAAVPVVTIAIVPAHAPMIDCGADEAARHAALARGIRFGRNPSYSASNDAVRAELVVNGAPVTPLLAGRAEVTQVAQGRLWENGTGQVRLYVPIDAFAPEASGRMPRVQVHVWNAVNAFPDTLVIPQGVLRALWDSELHWRAARLRNERVVTAVAGRPVLPMARDAMLRQSRAELDAGDHRAAAMLALARLEQGRLSREDERIGRLQLAFALDAEGEDATTRMVLGDVMSADPCLTFDEGTAERYAAMLDRARPSVRCTSMPLTSVALRAIVPGFAQMSGSRRTGMAIATFTSVIASFAIASMKQAEALDEYASYEAITGFEFENYSQAVGRMRSHYDAATAARNAGNTMALIGVGVWALAGVEAVLFERRHRRRIDEVTGYGGRPAQVGLRSTPRGVGLAITVGFR